MAMVHVTMKCENHPDLRWSCKSIAVSSEGRYNEARSIFYQGHVDGSYPPECPCKGSSLIVVSFDDLAKARELE